MKTKFSVVSIYTVLWIALLASAMGVVYVKHRSRTLSVELDQLEANRDQLNIEWSRLQLEQSTWNNHGHVEQVASSQMGMVLPTASDVKLVQP
jgi:cell division protein FtsL